MSWAIAQHLVTDAASRHILLCLANYADAQGRAAFPSVQTLCSDSGWSERSVRYKLVALLEAGAITHGNQRIVEALDLPPDRRPVVYDLAMPRGAGDAPRSEVIVPNRGAPDAPRDGAGCKPRHNGVQMATQRGAPAAPKPSTNHQLTKLSLSREADETGLVRPTGTLAGQAAIALTKAGFRCTSQDPRLLAALRAGATIEHLLEIAAFPECRGKPTAYVIAIAERQLRDQQLIDASPIGATDASTGTALVAAPLDRRRSTAAPPSRTLQSAAVLEEMRSGLVRR